MAIFDDNDFGIEEFAFGLGFGDMVAEEERTRKRPSEDPEPLVLNEDAPQWYEED